MPLYEFSCKTCDDTFEVRRSMAESNLGAECPSGHAGAVRLLSVFSSVGASAAGASSTAPAAPRAGVGCGSSCGCAH